MKKKKLIRCNLMLLEEQVAKLKELKQKTNYSLSELVRMGIDKIVEDSK